MKVTIFTSNQPRHISLINSVAEVADEVYAIQETTTVLPGIIKDRYDNTECMQDYFAKMRDAEREVFGSIRFVKENVKTLSLRAGDLSYIPMDLLGDALRSDYYIVFGASFIRGDLIDFLIEHNALNIHMGVSPYYRGSACNFWALYDEHPELVGATIHLLSKKLDAGDILYHAVPKAGETDPFVLGMEAVRVAHESLVERMRSGEIRSYKAVGQDKTKELRYTRNADFDDAVATEYMNRIMTKEEIYHKMSTRDCEMFVNLYEGR